MIPREETAPETRPVGTLDLEPGMRLLVARGIVRTVGAVTDSGYVATSGPIFNVWYAGPVPDDGWPGPGNSGTRTSKWRVIVGD
jgi:hypothetical protein